MKELRKFSRGHDYQEKFMPYKTYGIDEQGIHASRIEVYGDEKLRDTIIELLNHYYTELEKAYEKIIN